MSDARRLAGRLYYFLLKTLDNASVAAVYLRA